MYSYRFSTTSKIRSAKFAGPKNVEDGRGSHAESFLIRN